MPYRIPAIGYRAGVVSLVVALALASVGLVLAPAGVAGATAATAIADLAVRAEPADDAPVLLTILAGLQVSVEGKARKGYYPVSYGDIEGWAATGDLASVVDGDGEPADGRDATAIAAEELDLRAAGSRTADVVQVVPLGGVVVPTGEHADGFVEVRYEGSLGWALGEHLTAVGLGAPRDPRDYTRAEIIQIVYDAADFYDQPREDMIRVANCESDLIPTAVNEEGGSYGLFQFKPGRGGQPRTPSTTCSIPGPAPTPPAGCGRSAVAASGSASRGAQTAPPSVLDGERFNASGTMTESGMSRRPVSTAPDLPLIDSPATPGLPPWPPAASPMRRWSGRRLHPAPGRGSRSLGRGRRRR